MYLVNFLMTNFSLYKKKKKKKKKTKKEQYDLLSSVINSFIFNYLSNTSST